LPANATANNKTTPKTNSGYYYSVDTGAVCSFQCNTGYVRNATSSKCELSSSTSTTGGNNTEVNTDSVDNNNNTGDNLGDNDG
jgi:hypothetical protein